MIAFAHTYAGPRRQTKSRKGWPRWRMIVQLASKSALQFLSVVQSSGRANGAECIFRQKGCQLSFPVCRSMMNVRFVQSKCPVSFRAGGTEANRVECQRAGAVEGVAPSPTDRSGPEAAFNRPAGAAFTGNGCAPKATAGSCIGCAGKISERAYKPDS